MSQLDDTLLDALTHVTFPKGFVSAEPTSIVTVEMLITRSGKLMRWSLVAAQQDYVRQLNLNAASKMC